MKAVCSFLMRRISQGLLTIFSIVILEFFIVHLAPGDAVDFLAGESGAAGPRYLARLRAEFGLDQPLYVQLGHYLWNVGHLNLGYSFGASASVISLILGRLPATLLLMLASVIVSFAFGTSFGFLAARRVNTPIDGLISTLALLCYATPLFWLGLMAIVLFSVHLDWLPTGGMFTIGMNGGFWRHALDIGRHLILPAMTLALYHLAIYTRLMRASMLEVYNLDYVRTARAKGLSPRRVALRHVVPNAVLPIITVLGVQIGAMLGGAVLVETVFDWPGLGRLAFDAVFQRDYNLLLGIMLFASSLVVIMNILTDLAYAVLDPRIEVQ